MRRKMAVIGLAVFSLAAIALLNLNSRVAAAEKRTQLRVGVYDSRAIAIAYGGSEHWNKVLKEKQAALEQAKKDGDAEKVKEIEAWGPAHQTQAHLKAFGTAPVHDCFEPVKDKLPALAAANEVDVIVSKWEFDYLAPDAQVKDITDQVAALYNPGPKQLEWIRQMKDKDPLPEKEILEHGD